MPHFNKKPKKKKTLSIHVIHYTQNTNYIDTADPIISYCTDLRNGPTATGLPVHTESASNPNPVERNIPSHSTQTNAVYLFGSLTTHLMISIIKGCIFSRINLVKEPPSSCCRAMDLFVIYDPRVRLVVEPADRLLRLVHDLRQTWNAIESPKCVRNCRSAGRTLSRDRSISSAPIRASAA